MQALRVSVTVCSWNTCDELRACLQSLDAVRGEVEFEVIVWDNASEDGSADMVESEFAWVRLLRSQSNLGFGGGHNAAMSHAVGEILMPLNSDAKVHPGALSKLSEFMSAYADVGIVGPKLLNPDGTLQYSCRKFPTPLAAVFRNTPLGRLFPNNRFSREYLMQDWPHDQARDVDWVSGAAFCMSRECYEKTQGFDEQFFMYMEDVDLCYRAHELGFRVVYYPEAVVTHAIGRSTDLVANKMIVQFHKSMMLFYKKHYLPKTPVIFRPFILASAHVFLWLRKTVLTTKNRIDDWKRRTGRL
ncbi:MAG: glycosyltransferase family 2 protein [Fimbriimonadales bacterium]|nr:glycosyltransferase family 2 protein [Fimbriimonadales bacterium]